jgi:hypothetical protein
MQRSHRAVRARCGARAGRGLGAGAPGLPGREGPDRTGRGTRILNPAVRSLRMPSSGRLFPGRRGDSPTREGPRNDEPGRTRPGSLLIIDRSEDLMLQQRSGIVKWSLAAERLSMRDLFASPASLRLWACLLPTCELGPARTLRFTTWTGGALAHRSPACVPA